MKFYLALALILIIFLASENKNAEPPPVPCKYLIQFDNPLRETSNDIVHPTGEGKYGLSYEEKGRVKCVLKPIYDSIDRLDENYFKIGINNNFGLVYKDVFILEPIYKHIRYVNSSLLSFYPHILFKNIKIFYYWPIFYLSLGSFMVLLILVIRYGDLRNLFYMSGFRRVTLKIYSIMGRTVFVPLFFTLFLPWGFLLKYSLWANTAAFFSILVSMDLLVKITITRPNGAFQRKINDIFCKPVADLFPKKNIFFRHILYDKNGAKKFFLVRNLEGKWIVINKRLKAYGNYGFDELIEEKGSIFVLRNAKDIYYVYLSGKSPRVNRRVA